MAQDTDQIRVAPNGNVYVAPVGTAAPVEPATAPSGTWVQLGLTNEDGVVFMDGKSITDIMVWQQFYAARKVVESKEASVAFQLAQWSPDTVKLAFGGGAVTATPGTNARYAPPAPEVIDERALMVDWQDGSIHYRIVIPRGMVTENVETTFKRTDAAWLPITFGVIGEAGVDPWYLLTDDPAF